LRQHIILCDALPELDRCTVMQHIRVLETAGLLIATRDGRQRWNHLDVGPIVELQRRWISPYARASVALLARLKRDLEA
jgi:DNA-binding transcriptional ArsR family regulator